MLHSARSTGIFGEEGRGLVSALHLESHPALLAGMHSFGKALGVHGAVVVGSATLREFLVNYARPLIYSTALPLHRFAFFLPVIRPPSLMLENPFENSTWPRTFVFV